MLHTERRRMSTTYIRGLLQSQSDKIARPLRFALGLLLVSSAVPPSRAFSLSRALPLRCMTGSSHKKAKLDTTMSLKPITVNPLCKYLFYGCLLAYRRRAPVLAVGGSRALSCQQTDATARLGPES